MLGPGEYVCDVTEGITRVEDLPKPRLIQHSRNFNRRLCPRCHHSAYRLRVCTRRLHDLGDALTGRPRDLVITHSQHRCPKCNRYFNADMENLALPRSHYTHHVVALAVRLVVEAATPERANRVTNASIFRSGVKSPSSGSLRNKP